MGATERKLEHSANYTVYGVEHCRSRSRAGSQPAWRVSRQLPGLGRPPPLGYRTSERHRASRPGGSGYKRHFEARLRKGPPGRLGSALTGPRLRTPPARRPSVHAAFATTAADAGGRIDDEPRMATWRDHP